MSFSKSIRYKIILIIVFFGLLLNLAVFIFLVSNRDKTSVHYDNILISRMQDNLIQEIGSPPDSNTALEISKEYNIGVRYKYKENNWSTSPDIPTINEISNYKEYVESYKEDDFFSFYYNDNIYGVSKIQDGVIILSYYYNPTDVFNSEKVIVAIVLHLIILIIPVYLIIKWLLKPLNTISYAVNQIGEGNYDVTLDIKRNDEFGELADSLNNMTSRVKDSIKAKEQLLMDISHELRSPLTRIKFGLDLGISKEKINEDVSEIENMIKKTLDYYRNEFFFLEAHLSDTNIISLLNDVISTFEADMVRIAFLNFTKNKNKIIIRADVEKLTIALRNLISNALKYSPENKKIIVCLDETDKYYKISVIDYGVGLKKGDIHKIFEPFSRIDSSRSKKTGGYGLGLAIVKKIVDLHNAQIEVKSEENQGTEMIIKFKKNSFSYI